MIGIISDDFELFLKKNDTILNEIDQDLIDIKDNCKGIINELNIDDLKFISNKLNFEILQLDNILKKSIGYQTVLLSVYDGYQNQLIQIKGDLKKLIS